MKEIKDKKIAKMIENNPICKERFEAALKQACEQKPKPSAKPSTYL